MGFHTSTVVTTFATLLLLSSFGTLAEQDDTDNASVATFAGGCFWCMEADFDKLDGVLETTSGYMGGHKDNPTYKEVSSGTTGHMEVVQVRYDPAKASYENLLKTFWTHVDPTDAGGQFCDRGGQYRTGIFAHTDEQRKAAETSKSRLNASKVLPKPVVTEIIDATAFYPAEEYHQDYYTRNPIRYRYYRYNCGRDKRVKALWRGKKLPF